ncbi:hypothetical protein GCM10025865_09980 [Paraoerskovia sediminicola]|uniref:Uncharacterized protein n=1 Tax=Paraoerskovia sediminicola TaxID=1138587 RepID=A0ABM8G0X6_9CELL|nr:DUF308 domain-containing protein [Paraoerskovia sediminicola]BDZ41699.1 hypothetical protein GCM10025865_09980 [Paraoerskovia sediminicola]
MARTTSTEKAGTNGKAAKEPRAFRRVWWIPVVRGLVHLVLGLVLLLEPMQTLEKVPWIFGGFLVVDAVLLLLQGLVQRKQLGSVWWVVQAVVNLGFGVAIAFWPNITEVALYYLLVVWVLVIGVTAIIGASFLTRNRDLAGSWMLAFGLVSTLFGLTLLTQNLGDEGLLFVAIVFSLYAVVAGAVLLVSGFAVRAMARELRELREQAVAAGVVVTGGSVLGGAAVAPVVAAPHTEPAPEPAAAGEPTGEPSPERAPEPTAAPEPAPEPTPLDPAPARDDSPAAEDTPPSTDSPASEPTPLDRAPGAAGSAPDSGTDRTPSGTPDEPGTTTGPTTGSSTDPVVGTSETSEDRPARRMPWHRDAD